MGFDLTSIKPRHFRGIQVEFIEGGLGKNIFSQIRSFSFDSMEEALSRFPWIQDPSKFIECNFGHCYMSQDYYEWVTHIQQER